MAANQVNGEWPPSGLLAVQQVRSPIVQLTDRQTTSPAIGADIHDGESNCTVVWSVILHFFFNQQQAFTARTTSTRATPSDVLLNKTSRKSQCRRLLLYRVARENERSFLRA